MIFKKIFFLSFVFLLVFGVQVYAECTDSDGDLGIPGSYMESGVCTDEDGSYQDKCVSAGEFELYDIEGRLIEYQCGFQGKCVGFDFTSGLGTATSCEYYGDNYKCENGRCIQTSYKPGCVLEIGDFSSEEAMYQNKKKVTAFINIKNKGTLSCSGYDLIFKINGVEQQIEGMKLSPEQSRNEHTVFEAKEGVNTIEVKLYTFGGIFNKEGPIGTFSTNLDVTLEKDKCTSDSDCSDNNPSTKDACSGSPKKCINTKITLCSTGDYYCPMNCNYQQDKDCPESDKCTKDTDCNDQDISTKDLCSGSPKKCSNSKITQCVNGDSYCPPNCDYKNDNECVEPDKCSSDKDCGDDNACTRDVCSGTPKKCSNERASGGCSLDGNCIPIGTRTETQFCDLDNSIKDQKSEEANCNNNYECSSNVCVDSKCISTSFIQKIISWFKKLFG